MSDHQETSKVFSSELIQNTGRDMGRVESFLYGIENDKSIVERVQGFVKEMRGLISTVESGDPSLERITEMFTEATASLNMSGLMEFFAALEEKTAGDDFESLFQGSPANIARLEHLRRVATVNLMFSEQFLGRLAGTIDLSKEWFI